MPKLTEILGIDTQDANGNNGSVATANILITLNGMMNVDAVLSDQKRR